MIKKFRDKFALHILKALYGKKSDFACSFYGRYPVCETEVADSEAIGIVFQGPVIDEAKLREGLAHYRQLLPLSPIIVSTWKNTLTADFRDYMEILRIFYVESEPPVVGGIMNVNKQIVSTAKGIANLIKYSSPAILIKARTDYFPWRPDKAIRQMITQERLIGGEARLWGIDFNTRIDLPFSFSDIFQIGQVNVMRDYWSDDDLYPEDVSVQRFFELTDNQKDVSAILRLQPAEIYLARRYLERRGCSYDYSSLEDYQAALSNWFGILDSQHVELAFGKYSLAVPGYEPIDLRSKRFVKSQDWLAMIVERQ